MKKGEERKGEWYRPRIEGGGGRLAGSSKERLEEERKKARERIRRKREKEKEIRKLVASGMGPIASRIMDGDQRERRE
ncbi:hypothetical protein C7212DRAFT_323481, partial [Tuber magnatum]